MSTNRHKLPKELILSQQAPGGRHRPPLGMSEGSVYGKPPLRPGKSQERFQSAMVNMEDEVNHGSRTALHPPESQIELPQIN